ncbi:MAG: 23S rRNA (adenine(2503)-C(2))-methyltransferase RlmN [Candidatus Tectomicrobia bacterium]|uniref:Probable dual-specificity RNA methyltransferase RlmN n=1 Tax=Tectimicrobiota bacterium TaxID=2528274 RepID=A0A932GSD4_UNCTE|nr:23S rRNA (adenine(2503)-C(2))-methyltransferase RlmN [Candidatus Tectomicrobia bacterium]
MSSVNLKDLTLPEMEEMVGDLEGKAYNARQIYDWVFAKGVTQIDDMTNLSKEFRSRLGEVAGIGTLELVRAHTAADGTRKFLFGLEDGLRIESVLIPDEDRRTLCISTQVGCKLDCKFCLTGVGGFTRNLRAWEIVDQVLSVARELSPEEKLTNYVFMGMGEPLDNYREVVKAIRLMTDPKGMSISPRRITLSTSGLAPAIKKLGQEDLKVNLAVSLNASSDPVRTRIMPINKKYPLPVLLEACRQFPLAPRRRITFEYVLLEGVNDSPEQAAELARLLRGIPCKINLIPFNPFPGALFHRPSPQKLAAFQDILQSSHLTATIRESRGADILAACGQLVTNPQILNELAVSASVG